MNERIIALDIGDARIGVAVSDASRLIATPIDTIYRVGYGPDVRKVVEICQRYDTTQVLSGWPLNMDGTAGFQSEKVKAFCEQLEKAGLSVVYQDERLTTVTATNALIEGNMHRAERKHNVDKVAAAVILQQYLDTCRNQQQQEAAKMEEQDNIIELIDDETGAPIRFQHLATIEHEGELYIALSGGGCAGGRAVRGVHHAGGAGRRRHGKLHSGGGRSRAAGGVRQVSPAGERGQRR